MSGFRELMSSAANTCGVLGFFLALYLLGRARKNAIDHIRAHLSPIRAWAAGPVGEGWSLKAVEEDVHTLLKWHHPSLGVLPLASGPSISQLSLLDSVFLPQGIRSAIIALAQSIEAFNYSLNEITAFRLSRPEMLTSITEKMDLLVSETEVRMNDGESLHDAFKRVGLLDEEVSWIKLLAAKYRSLHVGQIGDDRGRGVRRSLSDLERALRSHGWLES